MKRTCRDVRQLLARGASPTGLDALHLEACPPCARVRDELARLDPDLASLRADAPADMVDAILARAAAGEAKRTPRLPWWRLDVHHPQLAPVFTFLLAALLLPLLAAVGQVEWDRPPVEAWLEVNSFSSRELSDGISLNSAPTHPEAEEPVPAKPTSRSDALGSRHAGASPPRPVHELKESRDTKARELGQLREAATEAARRATQDDDQRLAAREAAKRARSTAMRSDVRDRRAEEEARRGAQTANAATAAPTEEEPSLFLQRAREFAPVDGNNSSTAPPAGDRALAGRGGQREDRPSTGMDEARARALGRASEDADLEEPGGAVSGRVVDDDGQPFPFVTVFLEGQDSPYARDALTDEKGRFRFSPVPADEYRLYAFESGHVSDTVSNVIVGPGGRPSFQIHLSPAEYAEDIIQVDARRPDTVNVKKTDVSATLSGDFVSEIPLQNRRIQDIVALFPGVNQSASPPDSDISIGGGNSSQIGYRLNGASVNDPLDGGASLDIPTAAIDSFNLITTGYSAKYGMQSTGTAEIAMGEDEGEPGDKGSDERGRKGKADAPLHLDDVLTRFGMGALDAKPEAWRHVRLDRPVYFENTYLGGNARLALLDDLARGLPSAPHRSAALPRQWLDPPTEGGMALQVDLDRKHVPAGTKQRVFLQVGLKGGENLAWQRPPASVVVLAACDPRRLDHLEATLGALREGLDARDVLALATPGDPLRFDSPASPANTALAVWPADDRALAGALRALKDAFAAVETRGAVRNRRVVLLADHELGERVEKAVHRLALADVTTTLISLDPAHRTSHARVAMAGQGNLHSAASSLEAGTAASEELAAMLRVVARALRLNIRPAPGVELIQVLGTRPLARPEVQRVKAAERAVDRRVEETTGIAADRGADDPGLQTVIPAFLGGDEHVVVVELEVGGPGPVADVSLQYKDMVDVRNHRLRASASLARWAQPPSARQDLVTSNVLGFLVARELRDLEERAGQDALRPADAQRLRELAASLAAPRSAADRQLLLDYATLIEAGASGSPFACSLEHARRARLGLSR